MENVSTENVSVTNLLAGEAHCVKFPDVQDLARTVQVTASATVRRKSASVIQVCSRRAQYNYSGQGYYSLLKLPAMYTARYFLSSPVHSIVIQVVRRRRSFNGYEIFCVDKKMYSYPKMHGCLNCCTYLTWFAF